MKTLFTLAATALLALASLAPALAAPPPADLTITAERGQPFSLVLDGRLLTRPLARQVRVGRLLPGRHWAEFSVPTAYGPPLVFRTSVWLQPGLETDYVLLVHPYGPQLRQVGVLPLAGRPGYGTGGYYGPGTVPYGNAPGGYYGNNQPPAPGQGSYDNGYDPRGSYPNNVPNAPQGTYPAPVPAPTYPGRQPGGSYPAPTPAPTYPGNGQQNYPAPDYQGNGQPSYPAPAQAPSAPGDYRNGPSSSYPDTTTDNGGYQPSTDPAANLRPFAPADITDLVQDLNQRATDEERLRTATQALDASSLQANELARLMQTFTHDESRIELARFGYSHLSDPQNFSRVYGALQFKSSIRTLRQAVGLPQE